MRWEEARGEKGTPSFDPPLTWANFNTLGRRVAWSKTYCWNRMANGFAAVLMANWNTLKTNVAMYHLLPSQSEVLCKDLTVIMRGVFSPSWRAHTGELCNWFRMKLSLNAASYSCYWWVSMKPWIGNIIFRSSFNVPCKGALAMPWCLPICLNWIHYESRTFMLCCAANSSLYSLWITSFEALNDRNLSCTSSGINPKPITFTHWST